MKICKSVLMVFQVFVPIFAVCLMSCTQQSNSLSAPPYPNSALYNPYFPDYTNVSDYPNFNYPFADTPFYPGVDTNIYYGVAGYPSFYPTSYPDDFFLNGN